jgi:uncharacterized protein (UPF0371 family)
MVEDNGFSKQECLNKQGAAVPERLKRFDNKLYQEFAGALFSSVKNQKKSEAYGMKTEVFS